MTKVVSTKIGKFKTQRLQPGVRRTTRGELAANEAAPEASSSDLPPPPAEITAKRKKKPPVLQRVRRTIMPVAISRVVQEPATSRAFTLRSNSQGRRGYRVDERKRQRPSPNEPNQSVEQPPPISELPEPDPPTAGSESVKRKQTNTTSVSGHSFETKSVNNV